MALHDNKLLRGIILPILNLFNRDICIKHHWTGDDLHLNLFRHKGYWYHGKNREIHEMHAISKLVNFGDRVVEVGGHIGYLALLFAKTAGPTGKLYVFEPGSNNLPYLKKNLAEKNIAVIIEAGCGNIAGDAVFYEDSLTGQNNSFVQNFDGLSDNAEWAPGIDVEIKHRLMKMIRLDEYFAGLNPDFIKIDVEGFEYSVLKGAEGLFNIEQSVPVFMIEVQADHDSITEWFTSRGYQLYNDKKCLISSIPTGLSNVFALHPIYHSSKLESWLGNVSGITAQPNALPDMEGGVQ